MCEVVVPYDKKDSTNTKIDEFFKIIFLNYELPFL